MILSCGLASGCVRAGYTEGDRRGDSGSADWRSDGLGDGNLMREASADAPQTPIISLNKNHNSCQSPAVVDFAKIDTYTLQMNHTGATDVHGVACCHGLPDLILEVINVPNTLA